MSDHKELVDRLFSGSWNATSISDDGALSAAYEICEEAARVIERLTKERDEAESVVRFIANDYLELSHHKVEWQRNDWQKRCVKFIESLHANKLGD